MPFHFVNNDQVDGFRKEIAISITEKGYWRVNAFVERLWRSVEYGEMHLNTCPYSSVP